MTVFVMGCFSVSAATKTGFVTQKGKTYYINKDGSKQKGWLELKGKKYYFLQITQFSLYHSVIITQIQNIISETFHHSFIFLFQY